MDEAYRHLRVAPQDEPVTIVDSVSLTLSMLLNPEGDGWDYLIVDGPEYTEKRYCHQN